MTLPPYAPIGDPEFMPTERVLAMSYQERRRRDLAAQADGRLCACEGPHVSGCTVAFAHVVYFADPLPGDRAQMRADVIEDGRIVQTYPVGSPAPRATVEAAVKRDNGER